MSMCPVCFEEEGELTIDPDGGECCYECAEYFQNERAMEADNMRKAWKSGMVSDEDYEEFCERFEP